MKRLLVTLLLVSSSLTANELPSNRSERINYIFNNLTKDKMYLNDQFYHPEVRFVDPVGKLKGLKNLKGYYAGMYENVEEIKFEITSETIQENTHIIEWIMTLKTSKLNGGEAYSTPGMSKMTFDDETDKVIYHRDSFDMGVFIYEKIPLLGTIIKKIKAKFQHK